jgi:hypothetical protein
VKRTGKPNDPIIDRGYMVVPDAPGLGFELQTDVVRANLVEPGFFEPTTQWDNEVDFDGHM